MKFRKAFVGTAMLLSLSAAPAFAQHFDGPFVGVQAGWERVEVRDNANLPAIPGLDEDKSAFTGGLFVGYDRQVAPRVVVGAEAGMDFSSYDSIETANAAGQFSIDPRWSIDLTARAGYLVRPRTLVYARGGYETARFETDSVIGGSRIEDSENRDGWTVGAGVEQQLLQSISGRLEYRFSDLSGGDGTQDRHRLLAGIAYRF